MKSLLMTLLALAGPAFAAEPPDGKPVVAARAAESAIHLVEKLTALRVRGGGGKKVLNPIFASHLHRVRRVALGTGEEGAFKFVVETHPDAEGKASMIAMALDNTGAASKNERELGKDAVTAGAPVAPAWPEKDAATLAEEGLHVLLDDGGKTPAFKPYLEDFESLTLTADVTRAEPEAVVDLRAAKEKSTLRVLLDKNGKYKSHRFVAP